MTHFLKYQSIYLYNKPPKFWHLMPWGRRLNHKSNPVKLIEICFIPNSVFIKKNLCLSTVKYLLLHYLLIYIKFSYMLQIE